MWNQILFVAMGSAVGGVARYGVGVWMVARYGDSFPWGTLAVNVIGSFLIGFLESSGAGKAWFSEDVRHLWMTGVLGGFTTFSAFSLHTLQLVNKERWMAAGWNVGGTVLLCFMAVVLGYWLGRQIFRIS